ncbi:hypothetical protein ACWEOI_19720 [Nocardia sp. NPDC004340]
MAVGQLSSGTTTFRGELDELAFALVAYRRREPDRRGGRKSSNNGLTAECDCGRKIRLSRSAYDAGPITCGICEASFVELDVGQ